MWWFAILGAMVVGGSFGFVCGRRRRGLVELFTDATDVELEKWRTDAERTVVARIERRLGQIESRAREQGRITVHTVEAMFGIGERTASRYLVELTRRGVLARGGTGRETYFELTDRAQ
jgi:Fic family protein